MLRIGVQSAGWYNKNDPLSSFEYIKECGFNAVDFNIDNYFSPKELAEEGKNEGFFDQSIEEILNFFTPLKEASEKTDVIISQMHGPFPVYFDGRDDVNDYIRMVYDKCFAVCEYVGCPAIVVHPTDFSSIEEEWDRNLEIYRSLIPLIKKYKGVKICLENLIGSRPNGVFAEGRLSDAADCSRMIDILNDEAGGDYFGFCFDIGHANLARRDVKHFVKTLGHRLTVLHLHDNDGIKDMHMIPYSCLQTTRTLFCDWDGFVEGLKEINYQGTLSFETFRIFRFYPQGTHTEALKLISAIGRYWISELDK